MVGVGETFYTDAALCSFANITPAPLPADTEAPPPDAAGHDVLAIALNYARIGHRIRSMAEIDEVMKEAAQCLGIRVIERSRAVPTRATIQR